jgi:hypothetical protein
MHAATAGNLAEFDARTTAAAAKLDNLSAPSAEASARLQWLGWQASSGLPASSAGASSIARRLLSGPQPLAKSAGASGLSLLDTQALRGGASIVRFSPSLDGLPVFDEVISLLIDADGRPRALSARDGGGSAATPVKQAAWRLQAADAASVALADYGFDRASLRGAWTALADPGRRLGPFQQLSLPSLLSTSAGAAALQAPVRARPLWFRLRSVLRPAWYVETAVTVGGRTEHYAHVLDADSGALLLRLNLEAHARFSYQAYADPDDLQSPQPGPQGRADTPHPSARPDGFVPSLDPPGTSRLEHAPLALVWPGSNFRDPWLGLRDGSSRGNNVDAYADLFEPDGFSAGDVRAQATGPREFLPGYSLLIAPDKNTAQIESGVLNAFYVTNYLHDWFYAAGFDEASGNAQDTNFGRGGLEGDAMRVESLDYSGTDNASMVTPADGDPPRMQLLPFRGPWQAAVRLPSPAVDLPVQVATFGPAEFNLQAPLALGRDATAPASDGCQPLLDSAVGQVVLLDAGACGFSTQALHAQAAGASGLIIASRSASGFPGMQGAPEGIAIAALGVTAASAAELRQALQNGPFEVSLQARRLPRRDSAMDTAIVAHEWGHFISNRLIGDGTGLSNHQGRAMGEGWADFHALLLLVRPEDLLTAEGADYAGSYGVMNFVSAGGFPAFSPNASYFGIRRYPYSTRPEINPLSFALTAGNASLPAGVPQTPATVSNDNASVHNAGELWGSALWECYAGLLRETLGAAPRYGFLEAQRRMSEYLVAGYKLTPSAPTYTEARDALLAAIGVSDLDDLRICGRAFASRGMGLRARSAPRLSLSLNGVQESFIAGGDLVVDAIELIEQASCDSDGVLDSGETGLLQITVRNSGTESLSAGSLSLQVDSMRLAFSDGHSVRVPATAPQQQHRIAIAVSLAGEGRQALTVEARPAHPDIGFASGLSLQADFAVDFDTLQRVSSEDRFEAAELVWDTPLDEGLEPALAQWRRKPLDALRAVAYGPDFPVEGTAWLLSPELVVDNDRDFIVDFDARHSFEASTSTAYDGGVIEFSLDDGQSWQDVSSLATLSPDYSGELSDCCDNPLGGRRAFVRNSAGWPEQFTAHRVDFGRSLAGQRVRLRFGVATDAAVAAPGWEIDTLRASGILNRPFPQVVPDAQTCTLNGRFQDGFEAR